MTDPAVAAVITVNDMYHELQGVRSDVQTLVGKFDAVPHQIAQLQAGMELVKALPATVSDHEMRIRSMSKTVTVMATYLKAAYAVLGIVIILAAALIETVR